MPEFQITVPEEKITEFCQRNHVRSLALFGSVLHEDFRPDSDVDVLIEFEPGTRVGFLALSRIQRELSVLLDRPVDLVPRDGLKSALREEVLSSAEVLYAA
jgi:predicted nucleotidyltransferase